MCRFFLEKCPHQSPTTVPFVFWIQNFMFSPYEPALSLCFYLESCFELLLPKIKPHTYMFCVLASSSKNKRQSNNGCPFNFAVFEGSKQRVMRQLELCFPFQNETRNWLWVFLVSEWYPYSHYEERKSSDHGCMSASSSRPLYPS